MTFKKCMGNIETSKYLSEPCVLCSEQSSLRDSRKHCTYLYSLKYTQALACTVLQYFSFSCSLFGAYLYFCIFIVSRKLGVEKTNKFVHRRHDTEFENEFLSALQGSILVIFPTDSLTDVPSTPTSEIRNKGNLNVEKLN